jgi:hypothetical protein
MLGENGEVNGAMPFVIRHNPTSSAMRTDIKILISKTKVFAATKERKSRKQKLFWQVVGHG